MKTLVLRIVVDTEEDIFRDVEIRGDQNFEELHDAIIQSFRFSGDQMASFYVSNDNWEKGQEIGLMDVSAFDGDNSTPSMKNTQIASLLQDKHQKMLYVYDFLKMWIFYVEVIQINDAIDSENYPKVNTEFGDAPDEDSKEIPDLFDGLDLNVDDDFGVKGEGDDLDDFDDDDPFSEFEDTYDY